MNCPKSVATLTADQLARLTAIVGEEQVSSRPADLEQHARDESFHTPHCPAVVVWPSSTEEISRILRLANAQQIPVTAWGAGTSIEGTPIPVRGGIVLDMRRMDRVLDVRAADLQVDVQPGILYTALNKALARHGVFYAPDPGAAASIGGMIANNASGTRTVKYGATKDNVLAFEVVTASGEIIRTGSRSIKSSSGYDLVHLFVGSEGTLGIVTEATLRLAPLPEHFSAAVVSFDTVEHAAQTVSAIMGTGLVPAAIEFLSANTVRVLTAAGLGDLPENPTLLLEFHNTTQAGLQDELDLVHEICRDGGSTAFRQGIGRDERNGLWEMRHRTYEIVVQSVPGLAYMIVDVAAAVSSYPALVAAVEQALAERSLRGYVLGHAGDGNVHALLPYIPDDPVSRALVDDAYAAMVEAAIELKGTCTGEHGVGIGKRRFMAREHGAGLGLMKLIKAAFDPNGILNPGKMFED